jgi:hypothetical protein
MLELCLDPNLGGKITFGPECVKVAIVADEAVMCLSPEIRVSVGGYE